MWPGSEPSSGSSSPGTSQAMLSAPTASGRALGAASASRSRRSRRRPGTPSGSCPQRARADADEHHVAGRDLEPVGGALAASSGADRVARRPAHVEQHAAREQRRHRVDPQLREARRASAPARRPRRRRAARRSSAWWQSASMCVPECSAITSSAEALVRASAAARASWRRCSVQQHARARAPATPARRRSAAARGRRRARRAARRRAPSLDRRELPAVRLRQKRQRADREHVAEHAEGDRAAEPDGRREEADDAREQRAERRGRRCNRSPRRSRAPASGYSSAR